MSTVFSTRRTPLVIGHRGASGHALENSAAAFAIAADPSHPGFCDGVELDIHSTVDGGFVVHHDTHLASGEAISALALSTARARMLADGSAVPELGDTLAALSAMEVFVEVKGLNAGGESDLLAALAGSGHQRLHVHSFDHRVIRRLRDQSPSLSLGVLQTAYPLDPLAAVRASGASTLWQEGHLIDAELVGACAEAGIALVAWTVNDVTEAVRLRALGVDGLCGNWPERLRP